ncbi:MAG TPA: site-specific integrase [Burkholderiaceae bacterium]|nr:site-specific integrase [Burkholderiaceae bacterium]
MATLVRSPSGKWKAVIRRNGWPTTARSFRTRRDAEDWARRAEDEMVRGLFICRNACERVTVAEAFDRYAREISTQKKASTRLREVPRIGTLAAHFGKYSLAAVTPELVAAFRDRRLADGKANNTVRLELALLGHLFTIAMKEWHLGLQLNPLANIRKPSPGPGRNRRLVADEQQRLLAAVSAHSNPMLGWIVRLAIETGMRQSEIVNLRLDQVDLGRRVVRLTDTKNDSARTVPLSKGAVDILEAALSNPVRPKGVELVFFGEPGRQGKRRPYQFLKVWGEIRKRIGIVDLHFHDLRHEAISRLVEGGLSDQEVAAISRHKSMQMLKRYTHLRAEDLIEKLDRLRVVGLAHGHPSASGISRSDPQR